LKGHSVGFAKKAPGPRRLNPQMAKIRIRQPTGSVSVDMLQKAVDPSRRSAIGIKRPAAAAWAIARLHRFGGRRKEFPVSSQGGPGRTGRPAKYSRRFHGGKEDAVEARVAIPRRPLHNLNGW
jgi:hypothetical protein